MLHATLVDGHLVNINHDGRAMEFEKSSYQETRVRCW